MTMRRIAAGTVSLFKWGHLYMPGAEVVDQYSELWDLMRYNDEGKRGIRRSARVHRKNALHVIGRETLCDSTMMAVFRIFLLLHNSINFLRPSA